MNEKDMRIQLTESGFNVVYCSDVMSEVDVNCNSGKIRFSFSNGNIVTVDISDVVEISKAYNRQFGITLTDDGTRFFIQSWESGLFCFEIQTGRVLWHNKQKKAYQLATKGNTVLCRYSGKCISAIDVETGLSIRNYPLGIGTIFKPLSPDRYLVGPKRGHYEILDSNLERQTNISAAKMNPHTMDTFIIQKASLVENSIVISGVEYRGASFIASVRAGESDDFIKKSRFVRQIPVSLSNKNTSR